MIISDTTMSISFEDALKFSGLQGCGFYKGFEVRLPEVPPAPASPCAGAAPRPVRRASVAVPAACQNGANTTNVERWPDNEETSAQQDRCSWPQHVRRPSKQRSARLPGTARRASHRLPLGHVRTGQTAGPQHDAHSRAAEDLPDNSLPLGRPSSARATSISMPLLWTSIR